MAVALIALEPGDQHERPVPADNADNVAQHGFTPPFFDRLLEALREPVIDHRREVLTIEAVVAARHQHAGERSHRVDRSRRLRQALAFTNAHNLPPRLTVEPGSRTL